MRRRCNEVCPIDLPARNLIQLSRCFHSGEINKFHIFNTKPILRVYLNALCVLAYKRINCLAQSMLHFCK